MAITCGAASSDLEKLPAVVTVPPITLACWANITSFGTTMVPMTNCDSAGSFNRYELQIRSSPNVVFARIVDSSTSGGISDGQANLTTGVWFHAAAVFTSTSSRQAFRNGVPGTLDTTTFVPVAANIVKTDLGGLNAGFGVAGQIAFPAIWNVALSTSDILTLAAGAHPTLVRPANLLSCLDLNITSTTLSDIVSSAGWTRVGTMPQAVNPRIYKRF